MVPCNMLGRQGKPRPSGIILRERPPRRQPQKGKRAIHQWQILLQNASLFLTKNSWNHVYFVRSWKFWSYATLHFCDPSPRINNFYTFVKFMMILWVRAKVSHKENENSQSPKIKKWMSHNLGPGNKVGSLLFYMLTHGSPSSLDVLLLRYLSSSGRLKISWGLKPNF